MISNLFDVLFGCWHLHYSFPITMRASSRRIYAAVPTGTYVVCLECGKELRYDWNEMKVVSRLDHRNRTRTLVARKPPRAGLSLLRPRSGSAFSVSPPQAEVAFTFGDK